MSVIDVNATTLYYELRGDGPPLAFISGAGGDAEPWALLADTLADEFTVLTYDRRANSRSPRPAGWTTAPVDEQADDAAALLRALDVAPAVVYGNSLGAVILTGLALRHPQVLRGAIVHEPPLGGLSAVSAAPRAAIAAVIQEGMARGGPAAAMEAFLRWMTSDERFEALPITLRDRVLGNAEVFLGLEMPQLAGYQPTPEQLAAVAVPCIVGAGTEDRDPQSRHGWFYDVARVLAGQLGRTSWRCRGRTSRRARTPRSWRRSCVTWCDASRERWRAPGTGARPDPSVDLAGLRCRMLSGQSKPLSAGSC